MTPALLITGWTAIYGAFFAISRRAAEAEAARHRRRAFFRAFGVRGLPALTDPIAVRVLGGLFAIAGSVTFALVATGVLPVCVGNGRTCGRATREPIALVAVAY